MNVSSTKPKDETTSQFLKNWARRTLANRGKSGTLKTPEHQELVKFVASFVLGRPEGMTQHDAKTTEGRKVRAAACAIRALMDKDKHLEAGDIGAKLHLLSMNEQTIRAGLEALPDDESLLALILIMLLKQTHEETARYSSSGCD